ncbi:MAG: DUF4445 domain-containing protein [Caldilineaceae bacterium]|nr:DUF4445 domain-containing protein [Caldilineaceae bacterium]
MTSCTVTFEPTHAAVTVPVGTLVVEAAQAAGLDLHVPLRRTKGAAAAARCRWTPGVVRRRSSLRLSPDDVARGYALACQTVLEGDASITLLPQEQVVRRLTTDRTAPDNQVPLVYDPAADQSVRRALRDVDPPSLVDQTDDWSRLQTALRREHGIQHVTADLSLLRTLGATLRAAEWVVTALVDGHVATAPRPWRLLDLWPGTPTGGAPLRCGHRHRHHQQRGLPGRPGRRQDRSPAVDYNGQITRGEDVISRIIYAGKGNGLGELQALVTGTLNRLLDDAAKRAGIATDQIVKAAVAGNSTMIHLLLGLPPQSIRLAPFITTVNQPPPFPAGDLDLHMHPRATVDCLPGVASYVGADISAGVVSSGMASTDKLTLFLDVGTNGETAVGTGDWLLTCACSAGPAFEGAGVEHGMRATTGAIEEVWVHSATHEPTYRVIGGGKPAGICGSGLIALLAELFITGVVDRSGKRSGRGGGGGRGARWCGRGSMGRSMWWRGRRRRPTVATSC